MGAASFARVSSLRRSRRRLEPKHCLAPSVALLVLNDHVLKGAGILPGWLTGKVSDVVGLLVAALLVGMMLRRAGRFAIALACASIGIVFASINLSHAAARGLEALTALGPWPWRITVDPSDLLALPALGLGGWLACRAPKPVAQRGTTERALLVTSALACAASSYATGTISGNTFVVNDTNERIVLDVAFASNERCATYAGLQDALLRPEDFAERVQLIVPPGEVSVLEGCAARLRWDAIGVAVLTEAFGSYSVTAETPRRDAVVLGFPHIVLSREGGAPHLEGHHGALVRALAPLEPSAAPTCIADTMPIGASGGGEEAQFLATIERVEDIGDACVTYHFAPTCDRATGAPIAENDGCAAAAWTRPPLHLCAPPERLPFEAGDAIRVEEPWRSWAPDIAISYAGETEATVQLATDDEEGAALLGHLGSGAAFVPTCAPTRNACGAIVQPLALVVSGERYEPGDLLVHGSWAVVVHRAERVLVAREGCGGVPEGEARAEWMAWR